MIFKDGYRITARFLQRGAYWETGYHEGLDITTDGEDKTIYSFYGFEVLGIDNSNSTLLGNTVTLWNKENGLLFKLCHLEKIYVKKGQKIKKGDKIALMGGTGGKKTFPVHLHIFFYLTTDDGTVIKPNTPNIKNKWGHVDPEPIFKLLCGLPS